MVCVDSEKVKKNFYFPEWAWNLLEADSKRLLSRDRLSWATAAAILCFSEQPDDVKAHYLGLVKKKEVAQGYQIAAPLTPAEQAKKLVAGADRRYTEKKNKRKD